MKYIAVDYGKKKIGLAISDSTGVVAMPFGVFENNKDFKEEFKNIVKNQNINEVVLGKSLNFKGENNSIQKDIDVFKIFIESLGLKVHFVNEVFTSMESKWGIEKKIRREEKKNKKKVMDKRIDDKAAAMILKTFLNSLL